MPFGKMSSSSSLKMVFGILLEHFDLDWPAFVVGGEVFQPKHEEIDDAVLFYRFHRVRASDFFGDDEVIEDLLLVPVVPPRCFLSSPKTPLSFVIRLNNCLIIS